MKTLVLGLGNELLSDDGVGVLAVRQLKEQLNAQDVDVVESSLCGLALLEYFIGYERAIVIDAVYTGRHPPGTICELKPSDLDTIRTPSPHYAGFPEMLVLAKRLDLDFPEDIRIMAMEVEDPYTIGVELSEMVKKALGTLVQHVLKVIQTEKRKSINVSFS